MSFPSQVIADEKAWSAFGSKTLNGRSLSGQHPDFLAAIRTHVADIDRERLVLVHHSEGGSGGQVKFTPELQGDTLICRLARSSNGAGAAVVTHHCFALAVDPGVVKQVQIHINDAIKETLRVSEP